MTFDKHGSVFTQSEEKIWKAWRPMMFLPPDRETSTYLQLRGQAAKLTMSSGRAWPVDLSDEPHAKWGNGNGEPPRAVANLDAQQTKTLPMSSAIEGTFGFKEQRHSPANDCEYTTPLTCTYSIAMVTSSRLS